MHIWVIPFGIFFLFLASLLTWRTHWSMGLFFAYATIRGLTQGDHSVEAYSSLLAFSAFTLSIMAIPKKPKVSERIKFFLAGLGLLIAVITIVQSAIYPTYWRQGLMNNASMNGCLLAALLPVVCSVASMRRKRRKILRYLIPGVAVGLMLIAIGITQASTPLLAVMAALTFYAASERPISLVYVFWATIINIVLLWLYRGHPYIAEMLNDNGRFSLWGKLIGTQGSVAFGNGLGFTELAIPILAGMDNAKFTSFPAAHNDFIQLYLDLGLLGLALSCVAGIFCVAKSADRGWLMASFGGIVGAMLTNWPFHEPLFVLVFMLLLAVTFDGNVSDRV